MMNEVPEDIQVLRKIQESRAHSPNSKPTFVIYITPEFFYRLRESLYKHCVHYITNPNPRNSDFEFEGYSVFVVSHPQHPPFRVVELEDKPVPDLTKGTERCVR